MIRVHFYKPTTLFRKLACRVLGQTYMHCNFELGRVVYNVGETHTSFFPASEWQPDLTVEWDYIPKPTSLERFSREIMDKMGTLGYVLSLRDQPINCASAVGRILGHPFLFVGTPDELLAEMIRERNRLQHRLPPNRREAGACVRALGRTQQGTVLSN